MNAAALAPSILEAAGVDPARAGDILGEALQGADDGELFIERSESESFLFDDGRLDACDIEVKVDAGEVTLNGQVASREDKRRAEDVAESVSGVRHLQNNLRVRPPEQSAQQQAAPEVEQEQRADRGDVAETLLVDVQVHDRGEQHGSRGESA